MQIVKTIEWKDDKVIMIDQRKLPTEEVYVGCEDYSEVARAIENMTIRGAPAIGVAAAMGMAIGCLGIGVSDFSGFEKQFLKICARMAATRPTAVNLFWAIERMKRVCLENKNLPVEKLKERMKEEAIRIYSEDIESNRSIGRYGQTLLKNNAAVLTHCNAGALATAGFGTALGVIYAAEENGKRIQVYADETRPFLQGARLTAWELQKHGIQVTVLCDNMAGSLLRTGKIDCVIVGADRIAANGDVINKIGTYPLAVLAREHKVPFYVAAPLSTIDFEMPNGDQTPIEQRNPREVTHIGDKQLTPSHVNIINPAFDCTPHSLVSAIITDKGIAKAPLEETLQPWKELQPR